MTTAMQRRFILLGSLAAIAGGWQLAPRLLDRLDPNFDFEELTDPVGFRKIAGGEVSAQIDIFAGLDAALDKPEPKDLSRLETQIEQGFHRALFADKTSDDAVQVAYFSDFYCPYCRVLSSDLIAVAAEHNVEITWHETPLFGPASELAARAAIAAGNQGAYVEFHDLLVSRPVVVTPTYLERLARELGLDMINFSFDLQSSKTNAKLDIASILFHRFAFFGTPGMVVGRTVVQGRITATNLAQLIALERRGMELG